MSLVRRSAAALVALVALVLTVLLLSTTYGLAEEYGAGPGSLLALAALPLVAGAVAVSLADAGRTAMIALAVLAVALVSGVPAAAALGEHARQQRFAREDAAFACSDGPGSLATDRVEQAFHAVRHPAPYWLYGPISESPSGCTAGIDGEAGESFAAWRASLLDAGWQVERDDDEVVVVDHGVRLTLYTESGLAMLNASSTDAGPCEDGRGTTYADGRVGVC